MLSETQRHGLTILSFAGNSAPDEDLNRLVQGKGFDRGLLLALARESAQQCAKTRIIFSTAGSPFALLCDEGDYMYKIKPARGLADCASHYIMLMPEEELRDCDWLEGFLA